MKPSLRFAVIAMFSVIGSTAASTVRAASLDFTSPTPENVAVYVKSDGTLFDFFRLTLTPGAGVTFARLRSGYASGGVPLGPNEKGTYRNRVLDADPSDIDGGKGWAYSPIQSGSNGIDFFMGPNPAIPIDTSGEPGGRLFLANAWLAIPPATRPFAFQVTLELVNNGVTVQTLSAALAPEPSGGCLAPIALAALTKVARRRRRLFRASSLSVEHASAPGHHAIHLSRAFSLDHHA